MKKISLTVCTLISILVLTACGTKFDGSRTGMIVNLSWNIVC